MNHSEPGEETPRHNEDVPFVLPVRRSTKWGLATGGLAWLIVGAVLVINLFFSRPSALTPDQEHAPRADVVLDLQGRYLVGAGQLQAGAAKSALLQQLTALEAGVPTRRPKIAILAGELGGPAAALEKLPEPRAPAEDIIFRLNRDFEAERWDSPSVTDAEREWLRSELGWYGRLALAPAGAPDTAARQQALAPATRTMIVILGVAVGALTLLVLGAIGLLILGACWWFGKTHGNVVIGIGQTAVWAETFAVYIVIFVLLGVGFSFLRPPFHRAVLSGAAALLSLSALGWARLRGVPWGEIRRAIGWTAGRGILREVAAGVASYVMMLPFMAIGVIIVLILVTVTRGLPGAQGGAGPPTHPIVPMLADSHWTVKAMLLILAAVIAPLVEETMFRGVLYRHLREATGRLGGTVSSLVSSTFVSFVFAAVHPQGWLGIPVLMGMAYAMNLAREWRGSLIASMVMHGISNGLVLTLVIVILS